MQTIEIKVNDDGLNLVVMLLKNLKKGIVKDISVISTGKTDESSTKERFEPKRFFNVMDSSKNEIDEYLLNVRNDWDNGLDEK